MAYDQSFLSSKQRNLFRLDVAVMDQPFVFSCLNNITETSSYIRNPKCAPKIIGFRPGPTQTVIAARLCFCICKKQVFLK